MSLTQTQLTQDKLTQSVLDEYEGKRDDRNFRLSSGSGIVNHHFGIGEVEPTLLTSPVQHKIATRLHELEIAQIDQLCNQMIAVKQGARVLDAGCGRGGTAFSLVEKFGCHVDGITISPYQSEFCKQLAQSKQVDAQTSFQVMNFLEIDFKDNSFDHVITQETTMYVMDLIDLFRGFYNALKPGGRYTLATWCINEQYPNSEEAKAINEHYSVNMHTTAAYQDKLSAAGFKGIEVNDFTKLALPYWQLRQHWQERSGVEEAFIEGHSTRKILYLYITAIKPSA